MIMVIKKEEKDKAKKAPYPAPPVLAAST